MLCLVQAFTVDRAVSLRGRQFLGLGTNIRHLHSSSWSRDHRKAKFSQSYEYRRGCGQGEGSEADGRAPSCSALLITPDR